jgi:hypothetical protein
LWRKAEVGVETRQGFLTRYRLQKSVDRVSAAPIGEQQAQGALIEKRAVIWNPGLLPMPAEVYGRTR